MTTATAVGYVEMRIAKVVGLRAAEDEPVRQYVVLEEVAGDRQLAIAIGQAEAFTLAAHLGGISWPRPMTYQFVAPEVLQEAETRRQGDSPTAARLRRALAARPMTVEALGM
jgi:hypothetical protein